MESIKKSLKILDKVAKHGAIINDFAYSKYIERFGDMPKQLGTYHYYDGYVVVSEKKLRVNYKYGAGDMDFSDFFYIDFE